MNPGTPSLNQRGRNNHLLSLVLSWSLVQLTWTSNQSFISHLAHLPLIQNELLQLYPNTYGELFIYFFYITFLNIILFFCSYHQDYDGQRRAEKYFQVIILTFAVVGLATGFYFEFFSYTVYVLSAGFLLSALVTLPPWPMYRRKPLKWQKVKAAKGN